MSWPVFLSRRRRALPPRDDLAEQIAADDVRTGRCRSGTGPSLTPAERERWSVFIGALDAGLDPSRLTFGRMLVESGRVGEGD